jgi:pimeloyl-ACP methyl ester carboxylesterase
MPDLAGHGARRGEPFTYGGALADIDTWISACPEPPILVGDSLGGYLAIAAAARAGTRIAGVVAGGCTYPLDGAAGALSYCSDLVGDALVSLLGAVRIERWLERSFARLTARLEVGADAEAIASRGFAIAMRGVTLRALIARDFIALARSIAVPTIYINGAFDYPIRFGERAFARATPGARVMIAPGVGHGAGLTRPRTFAEAVFAL